ncbi:MAG: hypothetical protein GY937_22855 [bacterium]|nr:hypothetical protein [bacterium]
MESTIRDLRPVWERVADELGPVIDREAFEHEGPGWPQLAELTVEQRQGRIERGEILVGPRHPILQQTGVMRESLVHRNARGHVESFEADRMSYGTEIPYAIAHQEGIGVPQRKILQAEQLAPVVSRVFEDQIPIWVRRAISRGRR